MIRIIDRRFDSKKKSAVNRQRFLQRFRGQIRKAVADAISQRSITDTENGGKVNIARKDVNEPVFSHGQGGQWDRVHPGNDQFKKGDQIRRPPGGGGGGGSGKASQDGEGMDDFAFELSRDEFLDIFFEDLALPDLVKTQLARINEYKTVRAGHTATGVPANINVVRSMRGAIGRRIAFAGPLGRALRDLEQQLDALLSAGRDERDPEVQELRREIGKLRAKIEAIPFIDDFDLRYNNRVRLPQPSTQAVMFCVMDVSGSMDEEKKQISKRFFMLLYLFLQRTYEHIEVVFVRHHTQAAEVDEENFFHSRETGGTVVSSALNMVHDIIQDRYSTALWNIYVAQASDGDNWDNDSPVCGELLAGKLLPLVQYYAYIEIASAPQNLWRIFEGVQAAHRNFAMQRIEGLEDIYPVFRELFKKKLV